MPATRDAGGVRRLAVVGSPIRHSLSPVLQGAAARALGLGWAYERRLVEAGELAGFVGALDRAWLGLSVTAPLKQEASALADEVDERAALTGAVNTLLLGSRVRGWNTDVGGIVTAFSEAGLGSVETGAIVGAGATAQSALLAMAELGAGRVTIALRTSVKGGALVALGARIGLDVVLQDLGAALPAVDAAVSTLPASAETVPAFAHPPTRLLDADYARTEGSRFRRAVPEEQLIDGREMLLGQAVLQARIFASASLEQPLPDEERVVAAMRAALEAAAGGAASGVEPAVRGDRTDPVVGSASASLEQS